MAPGPNEQARKSHDELFPGHVSTLAVTDLELIELFGNFAFDEVLQLGNLDARTRLMVQLASIIASQALREYRVMVGAALTAGVTPVEIKEIVYQAVPSVGMAKVFDFIHATNEVLTERGVELPDTKVIVLTAHDPETNDVQAGNASAMGYLHKNTDPEELLKAVHTVATVANGDPFLSPASTGRVLNQLHHGGENGQASPAGVALTGRDKKLLRCLIGGLHDKEIAQELSLSEYRVRNLLSALYAKLGVRGRAQAAACAVEQRLI